MLGCLVKASVIGRRAKKVFQLKMLTILYCCRLYNLRHVVCYTFHLELSSSVVFIWPSSDYFSKVIGNDRE